MASEAYRALTRIVSNYARLFLNVSAGLLLVPLLLGSLGDDVFGLWILLGSTVGFGELFREVIQRSLNKELGAAYHDPEPSVFRETFSSAFVVSLLAAVGAAAIFAGLIAIVPLLSIPDDLQSAARWIIIILGASSLISILLAPAFNTYMATERMVAFNTWKTAIRISLLLSAIFVFWVLRSDETDSFSTIELGEQLILFVVISQALHLLITFIAVGIIVAIDPRVRFSFSAISRQRIRQIFSESSWNSLTVIAMNLHIRVDQIIMNTAFGLVGNTIFGIGVQISSYIRMLATGMTDGLESVTARYSVTKGDAIAALNNHSTRLHAWVTLPAAAAVLITAEPLLDLWVGSRLTDRAEQLPLAAAMTRILIVGIICRAISDGWVRILYGAGHVRRYVPIMLIGGVLNPIIAIVLLRTLPEPLRWYAPAIAFSAIMLGVHFFWLPRVASACLGVSYRSVLAPVIRPLVITIATAPALALAYAVPFGNLVSLAIAFSVFSLLYLVATGVFVVTPLERERIVSAANRRLRGPR